MNVSVIIPTCDRPHALERALASVNVSVECIFVVDDGSSASSKEVARVCGADSRVQFIRNHVCQGASFCRNLGAEQAQTEWLLFLDDDDQFCDGYLDAMLPLLEEYPAVHAWIPDMKGGRKRERSLVPFSDGQVRNRVGGCSGFMIHKTLFDYVGGFDVNFAAMQDWELWLRLIGQRALYYSGVEAVIYDSGSNQKITHNLRSKYLGLRRLYFKYTDLWTRSARRDHLLRLWVLRRLLCGRSSLFESWAFFGFRPSAFYYVFQWRRFAAS